MSTRDFNPYATPQTFSTPSFTAQDIYRRGATLVVPRASAPSLPCNTCYKCGQPAAMKLKRNLYWHHPALYLVILLNLLIYLVIALIVRKKLTVTIGLCPRHQATRRGWIIAAWGTFAAGIAIFVSGFSYRGGDKMVALIGGGLLVMLLSLVFAVIVSSVSVRPRRITPQEGILVGAGKDYLSQFPER